MKLTGEAKALRRLRKRDRHLALAMLVRALPTPEWSHEFGWSDISKRIAWNLIEALDECDLHPVWYSGGVAYFFEYDFSRDASRRRREGCKPERVIHVVYKGRGLEPLLENVNSVFESELWSEYIYNDAGLWLRSDNIFGTNSREALADFYPKEAPCFVNMDKLVSKAHNEWGRQLDELYRRVMDQEQ